MKPTKDQLSIAAFFEARTQQEAQAPPVRLLSKISQVSPFGGQEPVPAEESAKRGFSIGDEEAFAEVELGELADMFGSAPDLFLDQALQRAAKVQDTPERQSPLLSLEEQSVDAVFRSFGEDEEK